MTPEPAESPTWERLEDQIRWYDASAKSNQLWFKSLKVLQLVVAAAIPAVAAAGADAAVAGVLGAVVVVLEGIQQVFRFQDDWTGHRSTCEALKHEKYLFLAREGDYAGADREPRLARRVETLVSDDTSRWAAAQRELAKGTEG